MNPPTRNKIFFAADAHLGAKYLTNPLSAERKLALWLDSIQHDAKAIFFLGDMFDFWFEYKYVVPKGAVRFLGKLANLADQGVQIHLFTGNHDIWMFNYFKQTFGAIIHQQPLTIDLLGKRFYLAHGDQADRQTPYLRLLKTLFHNPLCQHLFAAIHPRWTVPFALARSLNSRQKGQQPSPDPLIAFANNYLRHHPDIHFFIFGHLHLLLDLPLNNHTRLLIAGDWMQHFSYIQWDGHNLDLLQFP